MPYTRTTTLYCPRCDNVEIYTEDILCQNCGKGYYKMDTGDGYNYCRCTYCGTHEPENINFQDRRTCPKCGASMMDEKPRGSGCYIATAIYGSYESDEVLVLRNFRDNYLLKRNWGKRFVDHYYKCSPAISEKLKNTKLIKKIIKFALDLFVNVLRKR